jgi:glucose/arabinose dehydrogenase
MRKVLLALGLAYGFAGCGATPDNGDPSSATGVTGSALECDPDNGGITLPDGFCAIVFADDLGRGRHLAVADNGDVYLALREGDEGVVALRDTTGDGRADVVERFGDHVGTEIRLDDGFLYFGTDESVLRYRRTPGQLVPDGPYETMIDGFPEQRSHRVKTFAFDESGNIYVNVGAPSNACQEQARTAGSPGQNPCPERERQASIWRFDANESGQTQKEDGHRFSSGIRNSVGVAWDPASKSVYVPQHGRDQLALHLGLGDGTDLARPPPGRLSAAP